MLAAPTPMTPDPAAAVGAAAAADAPEVLQQIGLITRQLHDMLGELGVLPQLQHAADGLPDARSRLNYIAQKTGEAADRVLNSVDQAKLEHVSIARATRRIARDVVDDPANAVATGAVMHFVGVVEAATARIDRHLTDIMLAQDFHDLTGQVVAKVISLAGELESGLVKLLSDSSPPAPVRRAETWLNGPVVGPAGSNVVADQRDVDDLLADMGI